MTYMTEEDKINACARAAYDTILTYEIVTDTAPGANEDVNWKELSELRKGNIRKAVTYTLAGNYNMMAYPDRERCVLFLNAVRTMAAALGMKVTYPAAEAIGNLPAYPERTIDWSTEKLAPGVAIGRREDIKFQERWEQNAPKEKLIAEIDRLREVIGSPEAWRHYMCRCTCPGCYVNSAPGHCGDMTRGCLPLPGHGLPGPVPGPVGPVGNYDEPYETTHALDREWATYQRERRDLLKKYAGKYVLIKHDYVVGIFETQGEAIAKGLELFPGQPILAHLIAEVETPIFIGQQHTVKEQP